MKLSIQLFAPSYQVRVANLPEDKSWLNSLETSGDLEIGGHAHIIHPFTGANIPR